MLRTLIIAAAFVFGVLAATPLRIAWVAISGGHSPRCLAGVCVGGPLAPALSRLNVAKQLGGLSMVMCGERRSYPFPQVLGVDAVLAGETCDSEIQQIHFTKGLTDIRIEVRDGIVVGIHTNPIYPITWP